MSQRKKTKLFVLIIIALVISQIGMGKTNGEVDAAGSEPAQKYGHLQVIGNRLCDGSGLPIQLKGVCVNGLQWDPHRKNTFFQLVANGSINLVRAAIYAEEGGYNSDVTAMKRRVDSMIRQAMDLGIYIIIDCHLMDLIEPDLHKEETKAFLAEVAKTYGGNPNIIYQISYGNLKGVWDQDLKLYAEELVKAIRKVDPDNIIVIGMDRRRQSLIAAANNPLDYKNIVYGFRYDAGDHSLRETVEYALAKGIVVLFTEGIALSPVDGIQQNRSQALLGWMELHHISWCQSI